MALAKTDADLKSAMQRQRGSRGGPWTNAERGTLTTLVLAKKLMTQEVQQKLFPNRTLRAVQDQATKLRNTMSATAVVDAMAAAAAGIDSTAAAWLSPQQV